MTAPTLSTKPKIDLRIVRGHRPRLQRSLSKYVNPSSFVIITGLSGSGKGTFLRALEDRGYFCVDNLPVELLGKFYELTLKSDDVYSKAALVIDVREGETL